MVGIKFNRLAVVAAASMLCVALSANAQTEIAGGATKKACPTSIQQWFFPEMAGRWPSMSRSIQRLV